MDAMVLRRPLVVVGSERESVLYKRPPRVYKFDRSLDGLVKKLLVTMRAEEGIGIAAPQIGEMAQVCLVLQLPDNYEEIAGAVARARPFVLINPEIVKRSVERNIKTEGCLSVPGYAVADIERASAVVVDYKDMKGVTKRLMATGMTARIIQHELDHLAGTIILHHMRGPESTVKA